MPALVSLLPLRVAVFPPHFSLLSWGQPYGHRAVLSHLVHRYHLVQTHQSSPHPLHNRMFGPESCQSCSHRSPHLTRSFFGQPIYYSYLLVGVAGFEPATLAPQTRCATKLRYTPFLFLRLCSTLSTLQHFLHRLLSPLAGFFFPLAG